MQSECSRLMSSRAEKIKFEAMQVPPNLCHEAEGGGHCSLNSSRLGSYLQIVELCDHGQSGSTSLSMTCAQKWDEFPLVTWK